MKPWASFCMSTYKRPEFLREQIGVLLKQSFTNFEIVISDNDKEASGKSIADAFNDQRIKYRCNEENLGMIKSFNLSIDRAEGEFVVMVTDDDPVFPEMLDYFYSLQSANPGYSIYAGCMRTRTAQGELEFIKPEDICCQILTPGYTKAIHWSSCLLRRDILIKAGSLVDYGSGHLVDHHLIVKAGSFNGAVIVNRQFSSIQLHQANYSKTNFENYYISCKGFYESLTDFFSGKPAFARSKKAIIRHLNNWLIVCFFGLRKFYTINSAGNIDVIKEIDLMADKIMTLPYMKSSRKVYWAKKHIFRIKMILGLIKF